jgi:benzoyl-CoA reductase subunit C
VEWAQDLYDDLEFKAVRDWLAANDGTRAVGYLPVYAPRELIHACGMLPVGIHGGGDRVEIIKGDAFYQSYICHLPRSVIELAQSGRLDMLSGVLFPSTCDVIRNLSGMWKMLYPEQYVRYIDVPQIADPELGTAFWAGELRRLVADLGSISGKTPGEEEIRSSIRLYNEVRSAVRELYRVRSERPWDVPTEELYLLMRAGEVVPAEQFLEQCAAYLQAIQVEPNRPRDNSRVLLVGSFCEQPPLGLIKTIERAGCYVVDDDLLIGNRFLTRDVVLAGDPIDALARGFVEDAVSTSVVYEPDPGGKRTLIKEQVEAARADGVIFAAASFCDPALLDRPMLRAGAEEHSIPCIAFKFAENSGQFQQFREQAGTFSDSIKLWGGE